MCKKVTVSYGDFIGTRLVGWCVYNGRDYSFISDKTARNRIKQGDLVNGLTLDEDEKVVRDTSFATKCLMGKSGLGFEPIMAEDEDEAITNKYYGLVKVVKSKDGNSYHFITSKCGYEVFTEEQVKAMLAIIDMGGIQLAEDGSLVIHKAVDVEDATEGQNKNQGVSKGKEGEHRKSLDVK